MKFELIKSLTMLSLLMILTACNNGGSSNNPSDPRVQQNAALHGLWLQEDEAIELRATGQLKSLCEELRQDPNTKIINTRLIQNNGDVYFYDGNQTLEEMRLGSVDASGNLTPAPNFVHYFDQLKVTITVNQGILAFTYTEKQNQISISYVSTTEEEIDQYFMAQDECRKP